MTDRLETTLRTVAAIVLTAGVAIGAGVGVYLAYVLLSLLS